MVLRRGPEQGGPCEGVVALPGDGEAKCSHNGTALPRVRNKEIHEQGLESRDVAEKLQ